jgi:putative chitinase
MTLSATTLNNIMPNAPKEKLAVFSYYLNTLPAKFGVNTPKRMAAFLAQLAHESGELSIVKEKWGPTKDQLRYEKAFGRLGNKLPGDGKRFLGRGLIQVTGRENYEAFGKDYFGSKTKFTTNPELLEEPYYAVLSSLWFWNKKKLNILVDANNFEGLTRKINGGLYGQDLRIKFWNRAKAVLSPVKYIV